jgi:predicted HTH transcriptional regulator
VAFANGDGGTIAIGVKNSTCEIVGISREEQFSLADGFCDSISKSITPQIVPSINYQDIDGKTLLLLTVRHGQNTPYYIKKEGPIEGVYIRVGATTRHAEDERVKELILLGQNKSYDEMIDNENPATEEEIASLCSAITRYKPDENKTVTVGNLVSWKLLKQGENNYYPSRAFNLLTRNSEYFAKIQCALFKGDDKVDFLDRKEFGGPLYEQIENACVFVMQHINKGAQIDSLVRKDIYELPPASVRELIVNAVLHRNYLLHSSIQVSIFDDRLEIIVPGGLYDGLTKDEMLSGYSSIRNRLLADTFLRMGLVEKWGTGIKRVFKECDENGIPHPEYAVESNSIRIELYRRNHKAEQVTGQVTGQVTEQVTEQVKRLAGILSEPLSAKEILSKLGLKHRPTLMQDYIQPALQAKFIELTQPASPNSPTQKYRLTEQGQQLTKE